MKLTAKTILLAAEVPPLEEGSEITIRTTSDQLTWGAYSIVPVLGIDSIEIDNGDGTVTTLKAGEKYEHTYAAPGVYRVHVPDQVKTLAPSYRSDNVYSTVYAPMILRARSVATRLATLAIAGWRNCRNMTDFDMRACPIDLLNTVFEGCTALKSLDGLPRALTELKAATFRNCVGLTGRIELPQVKLVTASGMANVAFTGCTNVTELCFAKENEAAIRACEYYDQAFGAENAVVKFEL